MSSFSRGTTGVSGEPQVVRRAERPAGPGQTGAAVVLPRRAQLLTLWGLRT